MSNDVPIIRISYCEGSRLWTAWFEDRAEDYSEGATPQSALEGLCQLAQQAGFEEWSNPGTAPPHGVADSPPGDEGN